MKKSYKSCMIGSLVATAALLVGSQAFADHTANPIPLRDGDNNVVTFGGGNDNMAYSARNTCGATGCHDYDAIERHSYHAQLGANEHKGWNPWAYGNMNSVASKSKPWVQSTGHVGKW